MSSDLTRDKKPTDFLQTAIKRDKLAHAYIFAGPEGSGKKSAALELAQQLLLAPPPSPLNPFFHPDYAEVSGEETIKIEQIRELIYKLSLKPYQAPYKVAVIEQAENMTVEASNALLKQLEEPKPRTLIILLTDNPTALPKTISSRAQKIIFSPLPGHLEKIATQSDDAASRFKVFASGDQAARLQLAYEVADLESPELSSTLLAWQAQMLLDLRQNPNPQVAQKLSYLAAAIRMIDQNANAKLALTNLMLQTQ